MEAKKKAAFLLMYWTNTFWTASGLLFGTGLDAYRNVAELWQAFEATAALLVSSDIARREDLSTPFLGRL